MSVAHAVANIVSTEEPTQDFPMVPEANVQRNIRVGVFGVPLQDTLVDNRRLPQVFSDCILYILQRQGGLSGLQLTE